MSTTKTKPLQPLKGVRILSLALNLPGPAALMRCRQLGARCVKLEPPGGDPMARYSQSAYAQLQQGIKVLTADLKSEAGQKVLQRELAKTDVLLTSFRPSALAKLGLGWQTLHRLYPALSLITIVGSPGERAEEPGHDLTYMAENGLVAGLDLPITLYADMGGSLMASEAVLAAVLQQRGNGKGVLVEVALAAASRYLGLPRCWGMTAAGGPVGGAHAGYRMYACKDGRVAVAALEPHFAAALCQAAAVIGTEPQIMFAQSTHQAIMRFMASRTRAELDALGQRMDIPLHTLAP